jgi:SAM-dependent methyltransferase
MDDHLAVNRANWDDRAPVHAAAPDYEVDRFLADPHHLSGVVQFDRERLGDIAGLRAVHLQCHIGTDTLSLHRLGARMTGLDLSPASLDEARRLARSCGADIDYVEADVERALEVLEPGTFDLVYTGIGALPWLPSVSRWAEVVVGLLQPGGRLLLREGHPMLNSIDGHEDGTLEVTDPYVETVEPQEWFDENTYVQTDAVIASTRMLEWSHGIGDLLTAVLDVGLLITGFEEHDSVPWNKWPGLMERLDGSEWRLIDRPERVPHSYTLRARKPG